MSDNAYSHHRHSTNETKHRIDEIDETGTSSSSASCLYKEAADDAAPTYPERRRSTETHSLVMPSCSQGTNDTSLKNIFSQVDRILHENEEEELLNDSDHFSSSWKAEKRSTYPSIIGAPKCPVRQESKDDLVVLPSRSLMMRYQRRNSADTFIGMSKVNAQFSTKTAEVARTPGPVYAAARGGVRSILKATRRNSINSGYTSSMQQKFPSRWDTG